MDSKFYGFKVFKVSSILISMQTCLYDYYLYIDNKMYIDVKKRKEQKRKKCFAKPERVNVREGNE